MASYQRLFFLLLPFLLWLSWGLETRAGGLPMTLVFNPPASPPLPSVPPPPPSPPPSATTRPPRVPKSTPPAHASVLDPRAVSPAVWLNVWQWPLQATSWTGEKLVQGKDIAATALQTAADPVYLGSWWENILPAPWVGQLCIGLAVLLAVGSVGWLSWETYTILQGKVA